MSSATVLKGAFGRTINAIGTPTRLQIGKSSLSRSSGICEPGTTGATASEPMMPMPTV